VARPTARLAERWAALHSRFSLPLTLTPCWCAWAQAKVTEALYQSLRPVRYGDAELAFLRAQLVRNADDEGNTLEIVPATATTAGATGAGGAGAAGASARPLQHGLFVGEVMLAQFKSVLERAGYQARPRACAFPQAGTTLTACRGCCGVFTRRPK
jgi:hypothetical protein